MPWSFDNSHSEISFSVRHMVFAKVRGSFPKWSGTVDADEAGNLTGLQVNIETGSVDTRESQRDAHLRSGDFFDSESHPLMSFAATSIQGDQSGQFEIVGTLSIRGTARPVTLQTTFAGTGKDPWGGTRRGYNAKASLNRTDFGLNWNAALELGGVLVGEQVDIELDVQIVNR